MNFPFTEKLLLFFGLLLLACNTSKENPVQAKTDRQPNIIFIMADDHTTQGFGVYGSRLARLNPTPNIDRLAKEGMLFENAFCTNSICTPSRASIMTGQYGHANGVHDLSGFLKKENQHLALELKELGYQTAMVGKWHLKYGLMLLIIIMYYQDRDFILIPFYTIPKA